MSEDRIYQAARTCTNCAKSETCHAFFELEKVINNWAVAGYCGAGAPGYKGDLPMFLAHCCLLFEFNKLKNKQ